MAITQATTFGLLPRDPGPAWRDGVLPEWAERVRIHFTDPTDAEGQIRLRAALTRARGEMARIIDPPSSVERPTPTSVARDLADDERRRVEDDATRAPTARWSPNMKPFLALEDDGAEADGEHK
jgi:hypothetical protein